MKQIILVLVLSLVLIEISVAEIGVVYPVKMELMPGESGRFDFSVQTEGTVRCSFSREYNTRLVIDFDDNQSYVEGRKNFMGTIRVPEDFGYGYYEDSFCVICNQAGGSVVGASTVKEEHCGIPLRLDIVAQRTKENYFVSEKEEKIEKKDYLIYAGIIVLVLTLLIISIYIKKKKNLYSN